jgi:hypothetical protein
MDSLALLCNLHADGPETLRRLRRAGVVDLRSLFGLGVEGIEPLLGRDRLAAQRFLKEARILEQRQLLADAEEAPTGASRPGGTLRPTPRDHWPATDPDYATSAGIWGRTAHLPAAEASADRGGDSAERTPRADPSAVGAPLARSGAWTPSASSPEEQAAGEEPQGPDEGLNEFVLEPAHGSRNPSGEPKGEPRHSVLSALLAAWSHGNDAEQSEPSRAGQDPTPTGAGLSALAAIGNADGAAEAQSTQADSERRSLADQPAQRNGPWFGALSALTAAAQAPRHPESEVQPTRTNGPWTGPPNAPVVSVAQPGPSVVGAPTGARIELEALLIPAAGAGVPPAAYQANQDPAPGSTGSPLSWLLSEQIDPTALVALERRGLRTLEQLLESDPRELSLQAGLSYTLVLRLQYLARRTRVERGS